MILYCFALKKSFSGLKVEHFIGGLPVKEDTVKSKGCHIAVGSPGRILHLITSGAINVQHVKLFVLDEADSLMESSFQSDINKIFHSLPLNKQMLAVSATFPNELDTFLSQYMHIPTHVSPVVDTPLLLGLKHFVSITAFNVNALFLTKYKNAELIRLLTHVSFTQCLIFCNYQTRAEEVTNFLNTNNWKADFISGAQTQKQRLEVLKKLKEFQCRILLSTDLTARGIDAVNVDLVINYDVPNDESTYLHRMGRAGRYGSKGLCITIASKGAEVTKFSDIIGAIGGCEMTVPVLPKENLPDNIWEADIQGFELINGTLKQQKSKDDIVRSVNEILRNTNTENETKRVVETIDSETNEKMQSNNVKFVETKVVNENVENQECDDDTTALLTMLAAGNAKNSTVQSNPDKSSILNKNISLLTVTGLLNDDNFDVDTDQTETIENYLTTFKEPTIDESPSADIEDVFIHAFNFAIDKTKPSWADLFNYKEEQEVPTEKPFNLLQDLLEYVANEENPEIDYDDYADMCEDYCTGGNDDENIDSAAYESINQRVMEWVPVIKDVVPKVEKTPNTNVERIQKTEGCDYQDLYDNSIQHLEENFNTMESVPEFEQMWSAWQQQMNSVRDYVQQNIYLNEMEAYKAGRHGN